MACSKAKLESNGDKASSCFRPFIRHMFAYTDDFIGLHIFEVGMRR
jgi:hypothetical protein